MFLTRIRGHEQQIKLLQRAIKQERVTHAYLFIGPRGIGKSMIAHWFATKLMCKNSTEADCTCLSCQKIAAFNHPDLHWFTSQGNKIKIEQIRDLQKAVQYKPYEGQRKIFIIDDADTMTVEAANSLLKVLEEPPKDTIFVLLAATSYSILPTILSRCQQINFNSLSEVEITDILTIADIKQERAKAIAPLANGSAGKALELAQSEEAMEKRDKILESLINLKSSSLLSVFKLAEELEKEKGQMDFILDIILFWYRDLLIWKEIKDENLLINIDQIKQYQKFEDQINKRSLIKAIEIIEDGRKKIAANTNLRLALEGMLIRLKDIA
jgi:DNA polymerase III subunit delta'